MPESKTPGWRTIRHAFRFALLLTIAGAGGTVYVATDLRFRSFGARALHGCAGKLGITFLDASPVLHARRLNGSSWVDIGNLFTIPVWRSTNPEVLTWSISMKAPFKSRSSFQLSSLSVRRHHVGPARRRSGRDLPRGGSPSLVAQFYGATHRQVAQLPNIDILHHQVDGARRWKLIVVDGRHAERQHPRVPFEFRSGRVGPTDPSPVVEARGAPVTLSGRAAG